MSLWLFRGLSEKTTCSPQATLHKGLTDVSCGYHPEHAPGTGQTCHHYSTAGSEAGTDLSQGALQPRVPHCPSRCRMSELEGLGGQLAWRSDETEELKRPTDPHAPQVLLMGGQAHGLQMQSSPFTAGGPRGQGRAAAGQWPGWGCDPVLRVPRSLLSREGSQQP